MKKTAKSNSDFGLQPKSFPKHKQWAVDQDYLDKLSPEDAAWLGQFNQEYYRNRIKKDDPKALHNTDTLRKSCYSRENAANRDLMAIKNVGGMIETEFSIQDADGNTESILNTVPDLSTMIDTDAIDEKLFNKKRK